MSIDLEKYRRMLITLALRKGLSIEDSQDLAQDTLVKAISNLQKFDPEKGCITTWLGTILHRLILDRYRKSHRVAKLDEPSGGPNSDAGDAYEDSLTPRQEVVLKGFLRSGTVNGSITNTGIRRAEAREILTEILDIMQRV